MSFYTNVFRRGDFIYVRKIDGGERTQDKIEYKPTVFITPKKQSTSQWKGFYGDNVEPFNPGTMSETRDFIGNYAGVSGFKVYGGDINPIYQFLNLNFGGEISYDFSKIITYTIDIETATESGFPNTETANEEVLLITVKDFSSEKVTIFSSRKTNYSAPNVTVKCFDTEKGMLQAFITFIYENHPDIITGWNIEGFDIPYLVNRITRVFDKKMATRLSPWSHIREMKKTNRFGKEIQTYDIGGVEILDYIELYKKFTYVTRESYKLDHIAKCELNTQKLDHSQFDSFKQFYSEAFDLFVNYNHIDVELVHQLEKKLKLIELAVTLAFMAKTNFSDVFSPVCLWDSIIHNYLWERKICIPNKKHSEKNEAYEGAYVKEPIAGFHNWVASFDATSLYPSIIQTWNISPEMLEGVDNTLDVDVEKYLRCEVEIPDDGNSYCLNGAKFSNSKQGVMPSVIDHFMSLRKNTKKMMLSKKQDSQEIKNQKGENSKEYKAIKNEISYLDVKQLAVKIAMNSLYGSLGTPYFRYYDINLARAITLNGQFIIRFVSEYTNRELNKKVKCSNTEFVVYCDTDSIYFTLAHIVEKFVQGKPTEKVIRVMDKFCEDVIQPIISAACMEAQSYLHSFRKEISFKREVLSDKGLWSGKKRYILRVHNSEGVQYATPEMKIMGLEMIKSSTPEVVREKLIESIDILFNATEADMRKFVKDFREVFDTLEADKISFPRTANGLTEYRGSPIYKKGTPVHVKGALIHNHLIDKHGLNNKYTKITDGDKVKFTYLLKGNPSREEVISFSGELPKEFKLDKYLDRDTMFEKTFLDPLNSLLEYAKWNVSDKASLEDFFG